MAMNGYYGYNQMPYNNYYPNTQQGNNGLTWVQGESAAKSWYVAPGTTAALWDSEAQVIYLKSADPSGMPSMKVLDYTIRDAQKPQESVLEAKVDYVTKEDLEAVYGRIDDLREEIESLSIKRTSKKKEDE